jgi:hypothetical protein
MIDSCRLLQVACRDVCHLFSERRLNMALVRKVEKIDMDRNTVHDPVDCTYTIFEEGGVKYLQLDTYGSSNRKIKGKKSQSLQFDEESLRELREIINQLI